MTPEDAIRRAVACEIVRYPTSIFSLNRDPINPRADFRDVYTSDVTEVF